MKSKLKAPRTERSKLKHDNLLSRFASKFNLRRYSLGLDVEFGDGDGVPSIVDAKLMFGSRCVTK